MKCKRPRPRFELGSSSISYDDNHYIFSASRVTDVGEIKHSNLIPTWQGNFLQWIDWSIDFNGVSKQIGLFYPQMFFLYTVISNTNKQIYLTINWILKLVIWVDLELIAMNGYIYDSNRYYHFGLVSLFNGISFKFGLTRLPETGGSLASYLESEYLLLPTSDQGTCCVMTGTGVSLALALFPGRAKERLWS